MAHATRGSSCQPDNMPWTKCGLTHADWDSLIKQIGIDITSHENLVALEGLAKHGQLWEDWIDAYLNGPLRTRYWCIDKVDEVVFSANFEVIRQVIRTTVSSIAREQRLKIAHSAGEIFGSSRASSVVSDTGRRSRTGIGRVKKAMKTLERKKCLDAGSKGQEIAPAGLKCTSEIEETSVGCSTSRPLIDRASITLGKKRARSTDTSQPETNKMRVGNIIQEPEDSRGIEQMQDIEFNDVFASFSIVSRGEPPAARFISPAKGLNSIFPIVSSGGPSAARFTSPAKIPNSTLASGDSLTPPGGSQDPATNLSTDSVEDLVEHSPAKRQKSNTGAIIFIPEGELTGAECGAQQGSATPTAVEISEDQSCGNSPGHTANQLSSLEQLDTHLRILGEDSTNPGTIFSSSRGVSSEWACNLPEQPSPALQDLDIIDLTTDVNSTATEVIILENEPPESQHEDKSSIGQRATNLPTSSENAVLMPTDTQINEGSVQKMTTKPHKGIFARVMETLQASDMDSIMPTLPEGNGVPTEGSVEHRCSSPHAGVGDAIQILPRNEVLAGETTDEPQINHSIADDAYGMVGAPAPQALASPIVDAVPAVEAPRSAPVFTFATAIFDPIRGTKSNYSLRYAAQAPTLDEFIMMLYKKHSVDKHLEIMKLRVFLMGDCVEIGVREEHSDWDWDTVMDVAKERGYKVSVWFEIDKEYYVRDSKD